MIGNVPPESGLPERIDVLLGKIQNHVASPELPSQPTTEPHGEESVKNKVDDAKVEAATSNLVQDDNSWKPTFEQVLAVLQSITVPISDYPVYSYHGHQIEKFLHSLKNKPAEDEWSLFVFLVRDAGSSVFLKNPDMLYVRSSSYSYNI